MKKFFVLLAVLFVAFSCSKESLTVYSCLNITPTYTSSIKAIMDGSCAYSGCHSAGSKADGIDLSTYASVKSASGKSNFLGSIQHKSGYTSMPKGAAQLADSTIQKISCWVQSGTPN
jgi:hypothetical protein